MFGPKTWKLEKKFGYGVTHYGYFLTRLQYQRLK